MEEKIDYNEAVEVKYDRIIKLIFKQYDMDDSVNILESLKEESKHYSVEFDELIDYIIKTQSLKVKLGRMLASQGFDRGARYTNLFKETSTSLF